MHIKPIQFYTDERPQLFKKRIDYAQGCYLERNIRKFKDREYTLYSNYIDEKLLSTLIYVKKAGNWIKSKLKYIDENGHRNELWCYNKKEGSECYGM